VQDCALTCFGTGLSASSNLNDNLHCDSTYPYTHLSSYGDVTVTKDTDLNILIGALYCYLAILVGITAFSAAAGDAYAATIRPLARVTIKMVSFVGRPPEKRKKLLHQHIRKIKIYKITEVVAQLLLFNMFGMIVSRAFVNKEEIQDKEWSWMLSFYWSVQTATTVGYGDVSVPFNMRWFQLFYLAFGTFFVGNAFGKLSGLKEELSTLKKRFVWQHLEVSRRMIEEMQAYEHDDKIDQYEFVVASLLLLDKINGGDIQPIMDKYRQLAGPKGYIQISDESERPHLLNTVDIMDLGE
jgi:Ion channel